MDYKTRLAEANKDIANLIQEAKEKLADAQSIADDFEIDFNLVLEDITVKYEHKETAWESSSSCEFEDSSIEVITGGWTND